MNTEAITPAFVRGLGIAKPKKISSKANELVRILDVKCPLGLPRSIGSFGAVCKTTVCIELACKLNSMNFPKEEAVRLCGVNTIDYQNTLITIQNLLKLKFPVSLQELCVHFACPGMKSTVDKYLEQYEERFAASLVAVDETTKVPLDTKSVPQKQVDFSNPEFKAAAFFQCAKNSKQKIERQKLIQFVNCNPERFNTVVESMEKLCSFSNLAAANTFKEIRERSKKRKRTEEDDEKSEETAIKELLDTVKTTAPTPVQNNTKKETEEPPKEEKTDSVKPPARKKLRQMNLNFFKK